ncbi:holo-ACP synthase [Paenibacillus doosanensis]|uniref:Holo-[acyl-carrier-protein] synthase n=1 Tax=Paenibacillus konkukensis TaxID=2020716 RepID=A0ABY4RRP9_9BACL|nr:MULTISPECIES: holo-ACP synthase [Paenibacillus]MCS7459020.1 holo-ACP synthase [Paenibacillus doosanensis]UQZ84074.1 Holo-[acyl-carrier-protein] synthase [Paenibacillus konkukensis]
MIIGIGTDLLDIGRVKNIVDGSSGQRFIERVLTPAERDLADARKGRLAEFVAGRFAAKEAVSKALGCGIGKLVSLQDIEVLPDDAGKPLCRLSEEAWLRLGMEAGAAVIHLSITHTDTAAMAYAIAERRAEPSNK